MLALTTAQQAALQSDRIHRRRFVWCEARNPETGEPDPAGFWDDLIDITHEGRVYHGGGSVVSISSLTAEGSLSIPGITVTLSGVDPAAITLTQARALAQAPIYVYTGLFDPVSHTLIDNLIRRFRGVVDDVRVARGGSGQESGIELVCESASRALTIQRAASRSEEHCRARFSTDTFYDYTGLQRDKTMYFGKADPQRPTNPHIEKRVRG